ncbi:unnamed protein product [Anisakis simplex]|uniref:DUF4280 domain-containing protein n=1 Tax=Anisakis simplex TaxID=6269 RepID=A0A0M3KJU5_ANISI|nr:unnamed protein product [Anisakis simplex]
MFQKEKNVFMMKCNINEQGWKTEVVACISPKGERIPVNSSVSDGTFEWRCNMKPNGMISLQQAISENAKCANIHEVGSKWQEKSFEFECLKGAQQKLIGCVMDNGEKIPVGGSKEINGYEMKCEQLKNGTILMHGTRKDASGSGHPAGNVNADGKVECVDSTGKRHEAGTSWIENSRFNKTCTQQGHVEIQNCVSQDGLQVPVDSQIVHEQTKYV